MESVIIQLFSIITINIEHDASEKTCDHRLYNTLYCMVYLFLYIWHIFISVCVLCTGIGISLGYCTVQLGSPRVIWKL